MRYTKKYLKNLLEENGISKTSDHLATLIAMAMENNLIDKNVLMVDAKEKGEKRPIGRPRKKEVEQIKSIHPKYERL